MNKLIITIIFFCFLTACGDSDETSQNPQLNTRKAENSKNSEKNNHSKSTIKVSGAENFTFEYEPKFACRDNVIHVMTMTTSPKFEMYLSSKAGEGTFELADYDANRTNKYVDGKAIVALSGKFVKGSGNAYGKFYFLNSKGQVTIKKAPSKKGEAFIAKVKASLQRKDGETINVDAELNLVADGYMMLNCEL